MPTGRPHRPRAEPSRRRGPDAAELASAARDARASAALVENLEIAIDADLDGRTTTEAIRLVLGRISWRAARAYVEARRVSVNGTPSLDPARRLTAGERVVVHAQALDAPPALDDIVLLHLDSELVVYDKPAGIATERHTAERRWPERRKALQPVSEELLPHAIARREGGRARDERLAMVHRLDRETSGVMVAARTDRAAQGLIAQFARHDVHRVYHAICRGRVLPRRFESHLVRDRGDGRRGSGDAAEGQLAITHVEPIEIGASWSLVRCRLETGRTHQIRIHLAEAGHPLFGDKRYGRPEDALAAAERHALHAVELGFRHPDTRDSLRFSSALPPDLEALLRRLRAEG